MSISEKSNLDRQTTVIPALSSRKVVKYQFLTRNDV